MIELLSRLDQFLHKAQRVHKPLQEFKGMAEFAVLLAMLTQGIMHQAKAAAALVDDLVPDDLEELSYSDKLTLQQDLYRQLPQLSSFLSESKITAVFTAAFVHGVVSFYKRLGVDVEFKLTNPNYLAQLKSQTSYLLNKSSLDDTTLDRIISIITNGKADMMTNAEIATQIMNDFPEIAAYRAEMITRTEVARSMNYGDLAAMQENGVMTKSWVTAGSNPCPICENNEGDGEIPVGAAFSSGDDAPPNHPNDECYLQPGEINLLAPELVMWEGE